MNEEWPGKEQPSEGREDRIEAAYWSFDATHNGLGKHKGHPQSERDAFKMAVREMLNRVPSQEQSKWYWWCGDGSYGGCGQMAEWWHPKDKNYPYHRVYDYSAGKFINHKVEWHAHPQPEKPDEPRRELFKGKTPVELLSALREMLYEPDESENIEQSSREQINDLADWFMQEASGEINEGGAVENAIDYMNRLRDKIKQLKAELARYRKAGE